MGVLSDLDNATSPSFYVKKAVSAYGARQHRASYKFTSLNESAIYYMDVGVWAGGSDGKPHTTFGLVCGHDMLLCSWMNLCEEGAPPKDSFEVRFSSEYNVTPICAPLSPGSIAVLKAAKAQNRGAVINAATALQELTDPNEPLLIIPDLHLTLYTETRVDRFRYRNAAGRLTSLDAELRALVDLGKEANARVIQVGDMYEVWESEILLRYQYLEMDRWDRYFKERNKIHIRDDYGYMLKTGKVIPRDTEISETTYGFSHDFTRHDIERDGILFWDTNAICQGIRKVRPALFRGGKDIFDHRIYGNHDNFLENRYWREVADEQYRNHPILSRPTVPASPPPDHLQFGPVWIDHGHRWDWHNANDAFWKKDRGFDMVVNFVAGGASAMFGKRSGSQDNLIWASNVLPDAVDYEMRLPALRRTDEIIKNQGDVRLVVMGHTHSPTIIEAKDRVPLLLMDSGSGTYRSGEYWYLGAAEEDRLQRESERIQREQDEKFEREQKERIQRNWDKR